ncbi:MAG: hypothetical protein ACOX1P_28170 [Thermoguttaceae bacterium]|jgi:hypothetical protein
MTPSVIEHIDQIAGITILTDEIVITKIELEEFQTPMVFVWQFARHLIVFSAQAFETPKSILRDIHGLPPRFAMLPHAGDDKSEQEERDRNACNELQSQLHSTNPSTIENSLANCT